MLANDNDVTGKSCVYLSLSRSKNRYSMKKNILFFLLFFYAIRSAAQYIPVDSARKIIASPKNAEEKYRGLRTLDRFYYTTGQFDSSALLQKEMFSIAKEEKSDSLMMQ